MTSEEFRITLGNEDDSSPLILTFLATCLARKRLISVSVSLEASIRWHVTHSGFAYVRCRKESFGTTSALT